MVICLRIHTHTHKVHEYVTFNKGKAPKTMTFYIMVILVKLIYWTHSDANNSYTTGGTDIHHVDVTLSASLLI